VLSHQHRPFDHDYGRLGPRLPVAPASLRRWPFDWPFEQRLLDADLAAARAGFGEEAFAAAYAEGRGLDEDAAVAYATRARSERRRPAHGWDSLTATEADVARLAAAALTNKQIAGQLLMGAETVKTHMARVYDKLDVHTRAALATAVTALSAPPARSCP
jgi:DNA-binding CsgD family transcriptional regulator